MFVVQAWGVSTIAPSCQVVHESIVYSTYGKIAQVLNVWA